MNITIIGAGNMGGAIAKSLVSNPTVDNITVTAPTDTHLSSLRQFSSRITTLHDNSFAVLAADIVVIAVKPWLVQSVIVPVSHLLADKIIISVAAGVSLGQLHDIISSTSIYRVMPNIAIEYAASVNVIVTEDPNPFNIHLVDSLFAASGAVYHTDEDHLDAFMSLTSCGIAFALRYMRAMQVAAIQVGIRPDQALAAIADTIRGAIALVDHSPFHPEALIDQVTTPGGITIKGLNAMEQAGFTSAVVQSMLATTSKT